MKKDLVTAKKSNDDNTSLALKQNKRIGVCTECGYEWIGRNAKSEQPPRCPECGGRQCVWEDTLSSEELKEIKPLLHGITDTTKKEVSSAKEAKPNEATPPEDKKQDDITPTKEVMSDNTPKSEPKPLTSTKPQKKEEKTEEKIFISELKEYATVIDNPNNGKDEEKPPVVAWKTKDGELKYGAVIDTETVEEIEEILETAAEKEVIPTKKDLDVLKAAGVLKEEGLKFEVQDSKTQPKKPTKKAEPQKGFPVVGLIILAGMAVCVAVPLFLTPKNSTKTIQAKTSDTHPLNYLNPNLGGGILHY